MLQAFCLPQVRNTRFWMIWASIYRFPGPRKVPNLPWPDIGHLAKWSVSSFKFGFGAECLRDGDPETFWQYVLLEFHMFTTKFAKFRWSSTTFHHNRISEESCYTGAPLYVTFLSVQPITHHQKISVYLSFPLDDSYTPSTLAIRAGTGPSDLQEVRIATLDKPDGWITFDVSSELIGDEEEGL